MHILPWNLLRQAVRYEGNDSDPDVTVKLSNRVFRLLVEAALARQPFDESAYLVLHQDVAAAVARGECESGHAHYLSTGYYEGRETGFVGFDEAWYLERYTDVGTAVHLGKRQSGLEHFRSAGAHEWRAPNPAAEPDIARWRRAITHAEPAVAAETADQDRQGAPVHTLHRKPAPEPAPHKRDRDRDRYARA